jgi:hypothetical protein
MCFAPPQAPYEALHHWSTFQHQHHGILAMGQLKINLNEKPMPCHIQKD